MGNNFLMAEKIYVTKENLENMINTTIRKKPKEVGLFTSCFIVIWIITLLPFIFGCLLTSLFILLVGVPFYYIDQLFVRRKINAEIE